ncbi:MAG: hypothetical protein WDM84_07140 [Bauldia sp.]
MILADDAFALAGEAERGALSSPVADVTRHFDSVEATIVAPEGLNTWRDAYLLIQGFEAWRNHGSWITHRKPV